MSSNENSKSTIDKQPIKKITQTRQRKPKKLDPETFPKVIIENSKPTNSGKHKEKKKIRKLIRKQRVLKTLDPETISKIINDRPTKKNTFIRYMNPYYGILNRWPCIRSHCAICPLSTVDYKPVKIKGPRKNVSRKKPKAIPKPLCPNCTRKFKAPKPSAAKRIKKYFEDRKRQQALAKMSMNLNP